ncbi:hypothetical protein ACFUIT_05825 [Streptomyces sp. NPDC057239]|uniref:hypothetical protein n=1 Tax=Streptomyces sp. NPDC057239 TaxID=3346061 RepID=UPI00363B5848
MTAHRLEPLTEPFAPEALRTAVASPTPNWVPASVTDTVAGIRTIRAEAEAGM